MAYAIGPSAVVRLTQVVGEHSLRNDGPDSVSISKDPAMTATGADAWVVPLNGVQDVTLDEGQALYAITAAGKAASVELI